MAEALVSRNNVTHAYNRDIAINIIRQTKNKYYDMFLELSHTLEEKWL